ncbi:DUF6508 domain-containing protein [Bifidobacterium aerophilum]|uniref:Uncharacterized protein n=1 Tax=Bifidobacterium aerophilum TaxID=1798155 RepID=A0A6N9Z8U5_9BIFI|nr:DUF6508 domain-containing protein [Bifidobacterium aerophilum]NEG90505.1 hypothetical protein [Bifidobacterium aerophilum]
MNDANAERMRSRSNSRAADIRPLLALTDAIGLLQGIPQRDKPETYGHIVGAVLEAFYDDWNGGDHDYDETLRKAGIRHPYSYLDDDDAETDALDEATLNALVTFVIRADHWNEGALAASIEDGSLVKLLRLMRHRLPSS